jgi:hypothetical protein
MSDRGYRLRPRVIDIVFGISGNTLGDLYDGRELFLSYITPTDAALALRWDLENGKTRQIDCHVTGGASMDSKDRKGFMEKVAVEFTCPDPTFYDPTPVVALFGASGGAAGMAIPWKIPWTFGASNINQSRPILYTGSWRSHPIVQISGPIVDPVVTNTADGSKLDFTGTTLIAGASLTIDTRYGLKTVLDQNGASQISTLVSGSNLAFALRAHPIAPGGVNEIRVTGTGIGTATEIYLTYNTRYIGF